MKDRRERRALPACGNIGGAEIVDHRDAQPRRQSLAVADLQRQAALGAMQQRLTMESDRGDISRRKASLARKDSHRLGMRLVHQVLGLGDDLRPRRALGQVRRCRGGAA